MKKYTPGPHADNELLVELLDVLRECEIYFDERADAEYFTDNSAPIGNAEMGMLALVLEAIRKATRLTTEAEKCRL